MNCHRQKQEIWTPFIALGIAWPKWIGFVVKVFGVKHRNEEGVGVYFILFFPLFFFPLFFFLSIILFSCLSAFQKRVHRHLCLMPYLPRGSTTSRAIICLWLHICQHIERYSFKYSLSESRTPVWVKSFF